MILANQRPTFSVIVPVFNAAATIRETIASIREQDEEDFELILVDDGSTDNSLAIMLLEAGRDPRIKLVSQANAGVSAARNNGAAMARGRLLAFCDADDLWHVEKLAAHRAMHEAAPDIGASYARIAFLESVGKGCPRSRTESTVPAGPLTLSLIVGENPVCTASNLVVTQEVFDRVGGFAEGMQFAEDQEWLARAVRSGERIKGLDKLLVGYRLSPRGLSVNLEGMYAGWRELMALHANGEDMAAAEALYCRYLARRSLRSGNPPAEARRFALRGMSIDRSAFLADFRRGLPTLFGALAAFAIPATLRQRLFA